MRRHLPLLTLIALFIALVLYFTFRNPIRVTTTPSTTFGLSDTELKEYFLWKLYAYPNSPYVVCEFLKGSHVWQEDGGSFDTIMAVIDLDKGQRVLRTDWSCRHKPVMGSFFWQYYRMDSVPFFASAGIPFFLLFEDHYTSVIFGGPNRSGERKILTLDGKVKDTNLEYQHLKFFPAHKTFLAYDSSLLTEFEWHEGQPKKIHQWDSYATNDLFRLEDGSYLGHNHNREEWVIFVASDPPVVRKFPLLQTLTPHLTKIPDIHWPRSISNRPEAPQLIEFPTYTRNSVSLLFEIDKGALENGTSDQIFKLLDPNLPSFDFFPSPTQDRIYFTDKKSKKLYYRLRTQHPDGTFGDLQDDAHQTTLPTKRRVFAEVQPFTDRMLYYADAALWTMNLDGTSEEKIFPKGE